MNVNRDDLEELAIALANAKDVEANAKEARVKAEEALADAIGGKENGSTSVRAGRFGITVKRGWNYTISDPEEFADRFPNFTKITEKIELCAKPYEEERSNNTNLFVEMSEFVTAKPKKVAVELKL